MMNAIVKSVTSGDSLILMGADASRGPPPEKLVSLSGIAAPRLGNKSTTDQPYAWASRDFLRRQTIGKRVSFQLEPQSGTTTRAFGSVYLEDGTSLAVMLAANGWGKVRPGAPPELVDAAAAAEAQGVGMHAPGSSSAPPIREVHYAGSFDPAEILQRFKGTPQAAIIEQVPNGSSLRVLLLPGFYQITLMLSGIQCGGFRRLEDGTEEAAPFAREARYFVETRLLNREVQVSLEGVDKNGNLLGTVLHPAGNVSVEMAKVGLARVVDWSSQLCPHASVLRQVERAAKEKRLRMWKDYVPPNHGDVSEYFARAVEIVSGDTVIVADQAGEEKRVSLSSLRCPRMGREPEPYAVESKELLRKLLIGKKVRVVPEYRRSFAVEGTPPQERTFVTLWYNSDKNAAVTLLSEGLAAVARHGQADERSLHYETLLETEETARAAKKGLHAAGEAPRASVADLTLPTARERAKRFLSALQRQGRTRAIVQFIPNGTRFKLLVPKENCVVGFACIGVRCPQCTRRDTGGGGEPFGDEAAAYARGLAFQREVEVEVETVDKNGTFLGSLYLPDKRNYAVALVEAGLAKLVQPAADRCACAAELAAAEQSARSSNLQLWANYSAEAEAEEAAAAAATALAEQEPTPDEQKQVVELELTELVDGVRFYAHVAGDTAVAALQEQLAKSCRGASLDAAFEPKPGQTCCARFTVDNEWYRAKVVSRTATEFTVFFLDYGNTDVVARDRLRPLDPALGPQALSPQAVECRLAYLIASSPDDGADGEEAAHALSDAAWGKRMVARVEDRDSGVLLVTLIDDAQVVVNNSLVSEGLLRVAKTADKRAAPVVNKLRELENAAKSSRKGVWRFGDIEEDDDFEFGMRHRQVAPTSNAWKK